MDIKPAVGVCTGRLGLDDLCILECQDGTGRLVQVT